MTTGRINQVSLVDSLRSHISRPVWTAHSPHLPNCCIDRTEQHLDSIVRAEEPLLKHAGYSSSSVRHTRGFSPVSSKVYSKSQLAEILLEHSHSTLDSTSESFTGYPHFVTCSDCIAFTKFHSMLATYMGITHTT